MRFDVITIFPEFFNSFRVSQIWKRAERSGLLQLHAHDLRNFTEDAHRTVDDTPYGGGPGMVMKIEPLVRAVETVSVLPKKKVLFASPQGKRLTQTWAQELGQSEEQLVIVAGRYEGVDERFVDGWVDECFSIGDYVLSGGEIPAMVLIEAVARVIPGVVGDLKSVASDSFTSGLLKFPQYTRPYAFRGRKVPEVLRSGDHKAIEHWRRDQALARTLARRPELARDFIQEQREKEQS